MPVTWEFTKDVERNLDNLSCDLLRGARARPTSHPGRPPNVDGGVVF